MTRLPVIEPRSAYIWSGFLQSVAGFGIGTYTFRFLYWVIVIDTTSDIFAFLTTEPNKEVAAIHPNAMPVVLTAREEIDVWMNAPAEEALKLQRPLRDHSLKIVARGDKKDEGGRLASSRQFS
jgi:putative SOS response-associated peptidase YedK